MEEPLTWTVDLDNRTARSEAGMVQYHGDPRNCRIVRAILTRSSRGSRIRICHDALDAVREAWAIDRLQKAGRLRDQA